MVQTYTHYSAQGAKDAVIYFSAYSKGMLSL